MNFAMFSLRSMLLKKIQMVKNSTMAEAKQDKHYCHIFIAVPRKRKWTEKKEKEIKKA